MKTWTIYPRVSLTSLLTLLALLWMWPTDGAYQGTVVAWGNNSHGQTNVPAELGQVKAIAAGGYHTLAVKVDGTVAAWGRNDAGQVNVPAGLTDVVAVSAGGYFSLALKGNGTVVGWGVNDLGQINIPAGLANVIAISSGWNVSLALKSDGTVVGWGQNNFGQATPPPGTTGIQAISSTEAHSIALRNDGTVVGWGQSSPPALTGITGIAANGYHDLALRSDGTVTAWGDLTSVPPGLIGVIAVAAGYSHNLALKSDGKVVAWGGNGNGQTNVPAGLSNVVAIAGGFSHSVAVVGTAGDLTPPTLVGLFPASNALLRTLSQVTVDFSEPVKNLTSADLLINGVPATSVITNTASQFTFSFPQPPTGQVSVAWAAGHGIIDFATNNFGGGSWSYTLDTNLPAGTVLITEFMAANSGSLLDEDGDSSDWVELYNPGLEATQLDGWSLTDDASLPAKWIFPAKTLAANGYLVVFASGKDRRNPGTPLHSSFKLAADGGYLALRRPDGSLVTEFAPYPPQHTGASYGAAREVVSPQLLSTGAVARVFVPSNSVAGLAWTGGVAFDDSTWLPALTGLGFDGGGVSGMPMPMGYWAFDDNSIPNLALDSSGNGHHGTLGGSATFTSSGGGRSGASGDRAMNFGACENGAYVAVNDMAAGWFDAATSKNSVTFAFWIYGSADQPCVNSAFHLTSASGGLGNWYICNAHLPWNDSIVYWDTGGYDPNQRVSISLPDSTKWKGQWNHYAFIKNGSSKQIWLNGAKILDQSNTDPLHTARSFYIGSGPGGIWSYGGLIDDFAVWDSALSTGQIQSLAAGSTPGGGDTYGTLITGNIGAAMSNRNASAYVRLPLMVGAVDFDTLVLRVRYDDGFVCWLNGVEVARRNAPTSIAWNSAALSKRTKAQGRTLEDIDISSALGSLEVGTNLLAFQVLNSSQADTDLLLIPELVAIRSSGRLFFTAPTPGTTNDSGVTGFVSDTQFSMDRGFFFAPTNISITCSTPGSYVIYTQDGTEPTPGRGTRVEAASSSLTPTATVAIASTTLLRAAAFKDGWQPSDVDTHTYLFPVQVETQTRPGWINSTWPDGTAADFAIDSRVVSTALPDYRLTNALLSIPTLSIVMPSNDLFSAGAGIYANPTAEGPAWEKAASAELIYPDGRGGFQVNCGVRIHGGVSRINSFTPKHSFSLLFRELYGASKLDFPLFTNSPVRKFDQLVVRGSSTDSMAVQDGTSLNGEPYPRWTRDEASQLRDQWMRDAQLALGHASARGLYVHLYLDGLYWGLYNLAERPDDSFAESYLGGSKEEYDVISDVTDLHAGDWTAWNAMMSLAGAGLSTDAALQRIQGNNPDGTRNPGYPVYLDLTNLVDYMIMHIAGGADDWPNHNWWASRRRGTNSAGFRFFVWDQELTNNSLDRTRTSHSPFPLFAEVNVGNSPAYLYAQLRANAEFRVVFGDRVHKHLFNRGQLSVATNIARWQARHNETDRAVVGESARWGDYRRPAQPYKREVEWVSNQTWMVTTYFPSNHAIALGRFRNSFLYPSLGAPTFSQFGGNVPQGFTLAITHTNDGAASIYYTTDGSDPRLKGGNLAPGAQLYTASVPVTSPTVVRARVRSGLNWSALVDATFVPPQDFSKLQLSEIMYNPPKSGAVDGDEFEFLEFLNTGLVTLDLSGLVFSNGINFTFTNDTFLNGGQYFVLARNATQFATRYPGAPLHGLYTGKLDNAGERLTLHLPGGASLLDVTYDNAAPWPTDADNTGLSLQRMNFVQAVTNGANWIAAPPTPGGPPGPDYVDSDGDGMPDGWENFYHLDPEQDDGAADYDHDGFSNWQEYIAGTDPMNGNDWLRLRSTFKPLAGGSNELHLAFTAVSNKTYTVLWSDLPIGGTWSNLLHVTSAPSNRFLVVTNTVPSTATTRFYRLTTPKRP